jgi:hypothetical protein
MAASLTYILSYLCVTSIRLASSDNTGARKQKLLGNRKGRKGTKRTTFIVVLPDKENDQQHGEY